MTSLKEQTHINEHAYAYQKIGNEQGVTRKFNMDHQGGKAWYKSVKYKSREESTENAL